MTIQVKICGICDAGAAAAAIEAGADLIGFHFCASDRRVTPEEAKAIADGLSLRPTIVGVFIDQDASEVRQIAEFVGLDLNDLQQVHHFEYAVRDTARARDRHFYLRQAEAEISMDQFLEIFLLVHPAQGVGAAASSIGHDPIVRANDAGEKAKAQDPLPIIVFQAFVIDQGDLLIQDGMEHCLVV